MKFVRGGAGKGPAILPAASSSDILEATMSGLLVTDEWFEGTWDW